MTTEPPKLLDQVRGAIRARHYSRRTEEAYVYWIRKYILFHGKRHPREMGAAQVTAFLTDLAVKAHVSASTQNQALSGLFPGMTSGPFRNFSDIRTCRRR